MVSGILEGIRVVDLTQNVAGPFCTQVLADLGAEIIKVERPRGGDDTRAWMPPEIGTESATFLALNRGKQSVAIDMSTPQGKGVVARLAETADVVIHSLRPASAERMGLGHATLSAKNPRLVYCAISAFGDTGPLRELPGYDPLIQAFSGIMSVTGNEGDEPVRVSVSLVDMGTGMWAAIGILAALLKRATSGVGTKIEASLLDTSLSWMTTFIAGFLATGRAPQKMGSAMAMAAPYQLFATLDGRIFIGAGNDRLFARVCHALGKPELATDPRFATNTLRVSARAQLKAEIEALTASRSTGDLVTVLRQAGAPCSELNDLPAVLAHEQVEASGMIVTLPTDGAPHHKVVGTPLRLDGERLSARTAPPPLGNATWDILSGIGIGPAELAELSRTGIINEQKRPG
jgi:crotonobetainyl-CoA:carnitine CoA-transferase CaiB-like acyl-CoA transferase